MSDSALPEDRVAIVGTRDWSDITLVEFYVLNLPLTSIVVSGHGGIVDLTAEEIAVARGMQVKIFPADWKLYKRAAGPIRNSQIVNYCTRLVAFWDGVSSGTKDAISKAEVSNKLEFVFKQEKSFK